MTKKQLARRLVKAADDRGVIQADQMTDFDTDFANQALRRFFVSLLGFELPQPADNIEQGFMWQAYRAQAGLPPDDGQHDAEPWHTARL